MTLELPYEDTPGHIGRITFVGDVAEMRIYGFAFPVDPMEKRVLAVRFEGPRFTREDVRPLEHWEIDAAIFPDRVEFNDFCDDRQATFHARTVTAEWVSHDIDDYRARVTQLDAVCADHSRQAVKALNSLAEARGLISELLRRAEIKSAASKEHKHRQAAAIEILHRLQTHFDGTA